MDALTAPASKEGKSPFAILFLSLAAAPFLFHARPDRPPRRRVCSKHLVDGSAQLPGVKNVEWFPPNSPLPGSFSLHPHVVAVSPPPSMALLRDDDFSRS